MEKRDIHIQNTSNAYGSLPLEKDKENKSTFFSNSIFTYYKNTHFNLLKNDIKKMRLIKKRDLFFNYFYIVCSSLLFVVFFKLNFINLSIFVTTNVLFLKFFKIYKYELLIYYKDAHFTKMAVLKSEITEVNETIQIINKKSSS